MAASLNRVLLMGNLTRDPELRYIPSGQGVTSFTIACNRTYNSQAGEKKEEVAFIRVVVWGRSAEACNEYLKKGSPVFVEGRLQSRSWEAQDGSKRSTMEVIAQNVQFLPRGTKGGGAQGDSSSAPDDEIFEDVGESVPAKGGSKSSGQNQPSDDEVPF